MGYVFCAEAVGAVLRPVLLRLRVCVCYKCVFIQLQQKEDRMSYMCPHPATGVLFLGRFLFLNKHPMQYSPHVSTETQF